MYAISEPHNQSLVFFSSMCKFMYVISLRITLLQQIYHKLMQQVAQQSRTGCSTYDSVGPFAATSLESLSYQTVFLFQSMYLSLKSLVIDLEKL